MPPPPGKLRAQFDAFYKDRRPAPPPARRARVALDKTYCILMTPRSGSTWLTRRIARLNVLSHPDEYFNANLFGETLQYNPGRDVYEVFDIVAKKNRTRGGIFGFEISYFDLEELELEAQILDLMVGEKHFFYLSRRNFVAQAISLYLAVESNFFHSFATDKPQRRRAAPYDDGKIMYWVCHILQQEFGIRRWAFRNGVRPMRLRYEELLEDIDGVIGRMADQLGVELSGAPERALPETERITADCAVVYEQRFRRTHPEFCRKWEAERGTEPCPFTGGLPAPSGEKP